MKAKNKILLLIFFFITINLSNVALSQNSINNSIQQLGNLGNTFNASYQQGVQNRLIRDQNFREQRKFDLERVNQIRKELFFIEKNKPHLLDQKIENYKNTQEIQNLIKRLGWNSFDDIYLTENSKSEKQNTAFSNSHQQIAVNNKNSNIKYTFISSGLLGKRYMGIGLGYTLPGDDTLFEWDPWIMNYGAGINLPINNALDGGISFSYVVIDGYLLGSNLRSTSNGLNASLRYSLSPNHVKNPYLSVSYNTSSVKVKNIDTSVSVSESVNSYTLGFGAELFYDLDAIFNNKKDEFMFNIPLPYICFLLFDVTKQKPPTNGVFLSYLEEIKI